MTQEEKFEEAKRLYETANADQRYVLESLFPELRESEDERIKSAAIEFVIQNKSFNYYLGVSKDDVVTWINRQGKQKPAAWSEEDKRKIDRIYSILRQASDTHAFSTSCRLIGDKECIELQDFLKSIALQNTWKPSDEQMDALLYVVRNYTPGVTERIAWESIKTLELMFKDLKKL